MQTNNKQSDIEPSNGEQSNWNRSNSAQSIGEQQPKAGRRLWPAVTGATAAVAIASAVLFGLPSFKAEANNAPKAAAPSATPVSVAVVAASQVSTWDEFSGRLEAV